VKVQKDNSTTKRLAAVGGVVAAGNMHIKGSVYKRSPLLFLPYWLDLFYWNVLTGWVFVLLECAYWLDLTYWNVPNN
jgi:hypothetical protein